MHLLRYYNDGGRALGEANATRVKYSSVGVSYPTLETSERIFTRFFRINAGIMQCVEAVHVVSIVTVSVARILSSFVEKSKSAYCTLLMGAYGAVTSLPLLILDAGMSALLARLKGVRLSHVGPRSLKSQGISIENAQPIYDCGKLAWWARWTYFLVIADLVVTYVYIFDFIYGSASKTTVL